MSIDKLEKSIWCKSPVEKILSQLSLLIFITNFWLVIILCPIACTSRTKTACISKIAELARVVSAITSCGIDGRPYFRWYLRNRNKRMDGRTCMPHSVFIILPVGGLEKSRAVLVADSISRVSHVHAPLNAANAVNERGAPSRLA